VRSPSRTDTAHSWLHTVARNHPQQQVTQENRHPESRNFGLAGLGADIVGFGHGDPVLNGGSCRLRDVTDPLG